MMNIYITRNCLHSFNVHNHVVQDFSQSYPDGLSVKWTRKKQIDLIKSCRVIRTYFGMFVAKGIFPAWSMRYANLRGADLQFANLQGANLKFSTLRRANLHGANLQRADLRFADLKGADLRQADLYGADLRGAELRFALTDGVDFSEALNVPYTATAA